MRRITIRAGGPRVVVRAPMAHRVTLDAGTVALIAEQRPHAVIEHGAGGIRVDCTSPLVRTGGGMGVQGPPGPPGTGGEQVVRRKRAAQILGGHRIVRSVDADRVGYADANDVEGAGEVLGLTLTAALQGADVDVMVDGDVEEASWSWTPEEPIYLGAAGQLTQTDPATSGAAVAVEVGYATSHTSMRVRIGIPVEL